MPWAFESRTVGAKTTSTHTCRDQREVSELRGNKLEGLVQLYQISEMLEYLPINTAAMRQAAQFWAEARQQGQPTANDKSRDVIHWSHICVASCC